jgi:hypothetical protein
MTRANVIASMVRLPVDLHQLLDVEAKKNFRSKNAEIIKRLNESFYGKPRVRVIAATAPDQQELKDARWALEHVNGITAGFAK